MLLGAAVIATGWAATPHPAGASEVQLHELLFNRAKRDKRRQEIRGTAPREQSRPRQSSRSNAAPARPVARISGPSYYTYAAPAVSTITLVSLLPDVTTTGAIGEEGADGLPPLMVLENDRFREALDHGRPSPRCTMVPLRIDSSAASPISTARAPSVKLTSGRPPSRTIRANALCW